MLDVVPARGGFTRRWRAPKVADDKLARQPARPLRRGARARFDLPETNRRHDASLLSATSNTLYYLTQHYGNKRAIIAVIVVIIINQKSYCGSRCAGRVSRFFFIIYSFTTAHNNCTSIKCADNSSGSTRVNFRFFSTWFDSRSIWNISVVPTPVDACTATLVTGNVRYLQRLKRRGNSRGLAHPLLTITFKKLSFLNIFLKWYTGTLEPGWIQNNIHH